MAHPVFEQLASLVRNGKYADVEAFFSQTAFALSVDHQDEVGNTLLHVAAQNGNKRIVKLLLRLGSNIDVQNMRGNSALHFAYAFGFKELGDYLISKGANDGIKNRDNLTPYEGLSSRVLENL
jgi:ankyrin repeat protein